jgi:predicted nucleic acid-binding protein
VTTAGPRRAVLDTSVLLAADLAPLPGELAISTASLAELHFGVLVTRDDHIRADRLRRLGLIESRFDALPVDDAVPREYGRLAAAVAAVGRQPSARVMGLLIAATAATHDAALYTRNPADFRGLDELLHVIAV